VQCSLLLSLNRKQSTTCQLICRAMESTSLLSPKHTSKLKHSDGVVSVEGYTIFRRDRKVTRWRSGSSSFNFTLQRGLNVLFSPRCRCMNRNTRLMIELMDSIGFALVNVNLSRHLTILRD